MHTLNWGPVKKNINFINEKPALVQEDANAIKAALKGAHADDSDNSDYSQKVAQEIQPSKQEQQLSDLKLALMIKHSDPLKYYIQKAKKKIEIHDESYKKIRALTKSKEGTNESTFRNKMFEILEKTNERVQLDRPFLIREKMQVIMLDSEKESKDLKPNAESQRKLSHGHSTQQLGGTGRHQR